MIPIQLLAAFQINNSPSNGHPNTTTALKFLKSSTEN
jgi:hypothetical protein